MIYTPNFCGDLNYIGSSDEKNIFAFTRSSEKDKILAIFNLSNKTVNADLMGESLQGSYKNYFTGKLESFSTVASFELNPWEYRVYTK
ncbi:MAG: alpha-glucosidase C-terminal domain-containing protein [Ignavibacteriaceae bacterium]|nr:alpha-glucosidase C-terminal domain-containing protein [Ignavibacteriaceae bacterium]